MSTTFPAYQNLERLRSPSRADLPDTDLTIAQCEKCVNLQNVKRELGRINRQLGNLREQIENTILSLE